MIPLIPQMIYPLIPLRPQMIPLRPSDDLSFDTFETPLIPLRPRIIYPLIPFVNLGFSLKMNRLKMKRKRGKSQIYLASRYVIFQIVEQK